MLDVLSLNAANGTTKAHKLVSGTNQLSGITVSPSGNSGMIFGAEVSLTTALPIHTLLNFPGVTISH